jgi:hypothetical protein
MEKWESATQKLEGRVEWAAYVDKGGVLSLADAVCMSSGRVEAVRRSYSLFLAQYPLCYGYWKRWAMSEYNSGLKASAAGGGSGALEAGLSASLGVWEQGCRVASHCMDHWLNYADFVGLHAKDRLKDVATRGVQRCLLDPKALGLWKALLALERQRRGGGGSGGDGEEGEEHGTLLALYTTALTSGAPYAQTLWQALTEEAWWAPNSEPCKALEADFKASQRDFLARSALETIVGKRPYFHVLPVEDGLLQVRACGGLFLCPPFFSSRGGWLMFSPFHTSSRPPITQHPTTHTHTSIMRRLGGTIWSWRRWRWRGVWRAVSGVG